MLRVATFNVNGIRAALRRGYAAWQVARDPDVVALQELRCPVDALPPGAFGALHAAYDVGTVPGRNGVAVLTREPAVEVRTWGGSLVRVAPGAPPVVEESAPVQLARGLGEYAEEGRYLEADLADRPVTVASLYLPKGGLPAQLQKPGGFRDLPDGGAKHARKLRFLDAFARQLTRSRREARRRGRSFLLLGDLNIAHTELDLTHWRTSSRMEGFLPEERAWLTAQTGARRLVDVQRGLRPDEPGPWSWWTWRGSSYANDVGWRIDYHLATPELARTAAVATTDRADRAEDRISDHAPVVVDYV